jgi:hypothetical protein
MDRRSFHHQPKASSAWSSSRGEASRFPLLLHHPSRGVGTRTPVHACRVCPRQSTPMRRGNPPPRSIGEGAVEALERSCGQR